jgi:hypothetical protein
MAWKPHGSLLMGDTLAVGFTSDSRFLLVVSVSGRGLYDIESGRKVARDPSPGDMAAWYRDTEADGIGPAAGATVAISGIDSPTADAVTAMLAPFKVDEQLSAFKGACISGNGRFLAIAYLDVVELYRQPGQTR